MRDTGRKVFLGGFVRNLQLMHYVMRHCQTEHITSTSENKSYMSIKVGSLPNPRDTLDAGEGGGQGEEEACLFIYDASLYYIRSALMVEHALRERVAVLIIFLAEVQFSIFQANLSKQKYKF